jgi:hypothetical protein
MFGFVSLFKKHVTSNLTINSTFLKSATEQHCYLLMSLTNEQVGCVGGVLMTEETPKYSEITALITDAFILPSMVR